jgi:hypothetical protein
MSCSIRHGGNRDYSHSSHIIHLYLVYGMILAASPGEFSGFLHHRSGYESAMLILISSASRGSLSCDVRPFVFNQHQHLQMGEPKSSADDKSSLSKPLAQEFQAILRDVRSNLLAASTSRRGGGKGWSTARATNGISLAYTASYSQDIFSPVKSSDSQPYPVRATVDIPFERPSILTNRPSFPAPFKTARSIAPSTERGMSYTLRSRQAYF